MRAKLSSAMMYLGFIVGMAAAIWWATFIWSFDWGTSVRGRGLWWMTLSIGSVIAFLVGLFIVVSLRMRIFPEEHQ